MRIQNALIPAGGAPVRSQLLVRDGVIQGIGEDLPADGDDLDAEGLLVLPGAIDPHVHFFDPGYSEKERFDAASAAAAMGGITTVIDMPDTSIPPATDGASVCEKRDYISRRSHVDFGLFGGISGLLVDADLERRIEEMAPLVLAIKTYATSGADFFPRVNNYQYTRILELTRQHDVIVLVHAEDWDYVCAATKAATQAARERGNSPADFYASRPELAETLSVLSVTEIARSLGAELHIVHLGTARAAEIVAAAPNVTGETCPHYLAFDKGDFERIGAPLKVTPPVKGPDEKEALWKMLADGRIDFLASDHAPGTVNEKNTGSIWSDYSGIPGGPILFLYALSEGYLSGRLDLDRFVAVTSTNAARRYRIDDRKGSIEVGKDADLVFVDPDGTTRYSVAESPSLGKVSPWDGVEFRGSIIQTMLRGNIVYEAGQGLIGAPGMGAFLAPHRQRNPIGKGTPSANE